MLVGGVLVQNSTNDEFRLFIQRAGKSMRHIPWHAVKGNHENRKWSTFSHWFDNAFADNLDEDCHSFIVGDIQFIGLNTEGYQESQFPKDWLSKTLQQPAKWRVAFMKKQPFFKYKNGGGSREFLYPIIEEASIDIVFSSYGRQENPEHKSGVW
ncbi:MAG: hypothetical protein ACI8XO_001278 [Verrucomicrobiales bacterium]